MDTPTLTQALAQAEAEAAGLGVRATAQALRHLCAPLRVVVVDARDMRDETPAHGSGRHLVFWGASDGHCWTVTQDPARAAGLFVAERSPA
jgi:hypothetical protein